MAPDAPQTAPDERQTGIRGDLPQGPDGRFQASHGIHALAAGGRSAMAPEQLERLAELRMMVATEPGRLDLRSELAARLAQIVEVGMGWLMAHPDQTRAGKGPVQWVAAYAGLLSRILRDWPPDEEPSEQRQAVEAMKRLILAEHDEQS